ncbi:hypothetical protein EG68_05656 [Paragonimus skrjabini miyazakii]|uniref:Peptidase M14 domain-containing protein n=1 Tax=Paragonimus skrjabini miyazakii TaxID=59628 RepID=A0A8S9YUQ2_9TREM|nr:hypothetical protein EG68_05656 [Paragonimus skrjabini miyazakii]
MRLKGLLCISLLVINTIHSFEFDGYHKTSQIETFLNGIHEKCPEITRVYNLKWENISRTIRGNPLTVIEFAKFPGRHVTGIPEFKYVANMHGDETVGRELLLMLASELCVGYMSAILRIQRLINGTRIHLLSSMNPDGYDVSSTSSDKDGRLNGNGVDLNRNFPNMDSVVFHNMGKENAPLDHLFSGSINNSKFEPETKMVMQWMEDINFVLSANLHGGSMVVNYPYDSSPPGESRLNETPDHPIFIELALSYADQNPEMRTGEHTCKDDDKHFEQGIVNGADWYPINGSMQDYSYLATNAFELTMELGCTKFPKASWLPVHRGVKGMIYGFDGVSVLPLPNVIVRVFNNTSAGEPSPITHNIWSGRDGDYYRLLTRGRFILMFEAPGFDTAVACADIDQVPSWNDGFQAAQTINVLLLKSGLKNEYVDLKDLLEKPVKFQASSRKPLVCSSDQEE